MRLSKDWRTLLKLTGKITGILLLAGFFTLGGIAFGAVRGIIERTPGLDLDSIARHGSMSGSGAVIVMDDSRSMPWAMNNINRFYAHESCGQCTPCREGCPWMMKLSTRILEGKAAPSDVDLLIEVANQIEGKTVCAFGEAASWPTQAMVSKFKEEFVALTDPFNACLPHTEEGREQNRFLTR